MDHYPSTHEGMLLFDWLIPWSKFSQCRNCKSEYVFVGDIQFYPDSFVMLVIVLNLSYPPFFSSFWCMLSETLHSLALQILALLADTLIEIQEQVLSNEDEVIIRPWASLFPFPSLNWVELEIANSVLRSSRIANGKKRMKETLKLRKTCYVQMVPPNSANPHMTNLKQWLVSRSFFSFTYMATIPLNLIS